MEVWIHPSLRIKALGLTPSSWIHNFWSIPVFPIPYSWRMFHHFLYRMTHLAAVASPPLTESHIPRCSPVHVGYVIVVECTNARVLYFTPQNAGGGIRTHKPLFLRQLAMPFAYPRITRHLLLVQKTGLEPATLNLSGLRSSNWAILAVSKVCCLCL